MTIANCIGCCLVALVIGGCIGFLARMHTLQDTVLAAMAYRAAAEESYYDTQHRQMLAQLDKEERTPRPAKKGRK